MRAAGFGSLTAFEPFQASVYCHMTAAAKDRNVFRSVIACIPISVMAITSRRTT